jgi:hypothetical protein
LEIRGWEIVRPRLELFGFDEEFFEKIKIIFLKIGTFRRPGKTGRWGFFMITVWTLERVSSFPGSAWERESIS